MTFTIDMDIERERLLRAELYAAREELPDGVARPVVGWDLDSTVAHTLHRQSMIPDIKAGLLTWQYYSLACRLDKPIEQSVTLMTLLRRQYDQVAISARDQAAEAVTRRWARAHKVPLDEIHLREDSDQDSGPGTDWKVRKINSLQESGVLVVMFFEDWPETAELIRRETGVPVMVVNPVYPCLACGSRDRACPCGEARMLAGAF